MRRKVRSAAMLPLWWWMQEAIGATWQDGDSATTAPVYVGVGVHACVYLRVQQAWMRVQCSSCTCRG